MALQSQYPESIQRRQLEHSSDDDTVNLSSIEDAILDTIPRIGAEKLARLMEVLVEVGVSSVSDLKYVAEEDIRQYLTPIELRKLISRWKAPFSPQESQRVQSQSILEPSQSSDTHSDNGSSPNSQEFPQAQTDFSVPWYKMPHQLMVSLENKERPSPRLRKEMVRIIIDHFSKPGFELQRKKTLRFIAHDIVVKYPSSFRDEVDGEQVGSGYESLLSQFVNRVDNLARDKHHNSLKRSLAQTLTDNGKPAKKHVTDSYGCVNWQPASLPENETEVSQKEKMENMKQAYKSGKHDINISELMKATYATQRKMINSNDCVLENIMEDWPYLLEEKYFLEHVKELLGIDMMDKVKQSASKKMKSIINFMKEEAKSRTMLTSSVKLVSDAIDKKGDNLPAVMGSLLLICSYVGDDFSTIFVHTEVPESCEDMDLPGTPYMIAIGQPLEANRFHISVGKRVITKVGNPLAALAVWFSSFFMFNLQYPPKAAVLCEFVQRCFFGINPQTGSKSVKEKGGKKNHIQPGVLRLVNKIKDFEFKTEWDV